MTAKQISEQENLSRSGCIGIMETEPGRPGSIPEKRCYTVEDLQVILCCGRETIYNLLKKQEFRWFRVGGKGGAYRISKKSFDAWLDTML